MIGYSDRVIMGWRLSMSLKNTPFLIPKSCAGLEITPTFIKRGGTGCYC